MTLLLYCSFPTRPPYTARSNVLKSTWSKQRLVPSRLWRWHCCCSSLPGCALRPFPLENMPRWEKEAKLPVESTCLYLPAIKWLFLRSVYMDFGSNLGISLCSAKKIILLICGSFFFPSSENKNCYPYLSLQKPMTISPAPTLSMLRKPSFSRETTE